MQGKQFKLIYFSLKGSEVKQICLGWKPLIGVAVLAFSVLLLITFGVIGLFTDSFHNYRITHLSKANSALSGELDKMEQKVAGIVKVVEDIEKKDQDLRVFVDLPVRPDDIKQLGVGGRSNDTYATSSLDVKIREKAFEVNQTIKDMNRRLEYAQESRDQIVSKYSKDDAALKTTPSVRPVVGGRISDYFGYRIDPFTEKLKPHEGIDYSVPRGTNVVATAAGKVIEVITRYAPNTGYGRQILIDHQNGYLTRYAHLSKTLVKEGQWVTRHTVIGKVGDTGRSTAPHLHYEVLQNEKRVNPQAFVLDEPGN